MKNFIDFSQWKAWQTCPAGWYELYVNKRRKSWPEGPREDALAIGTLVHEGLRVWKQLQRVEIPTEVIEEINPSRDTLEMCKEMVYGYTKVYPREEWTVLKCEEPLRFPLIPTHAVDPACLCTTIGEINSGDCIVGCSCECHFPMGVDGLAKVDTYFYNPTLIELPTGVDGTTLTLTPGWWIEEYKTKAPDIPLGNWMARWEMAAQASFQILALQAKIEKELEGTKGDIYREKVQGVLVNILEKPKLYQPKRKCKKCGGSYEFASWMPKGEEYACPMCGNVQKVAKLKEDPSTSPPNYYRMIVTRGEKQLERDKEMFGKVAEQMSQMREGGLESFPWNTENCIGAFMKSSCQYLNNHARGLSTLEDSMMVEVEDYVKEKEENY